MHLDTVLSKGARILAPGDWVTYDIYFGASSEPPLVASGSSDTVYDPGLLEQETTYYRQIVATDDEGNQIESPVWRFTTRGRLGAMPWLIILLEGD